MKKILISALLIQSNLLFPMSTSLERVNEQADPFDPSREYTLIENNITERDGEYFVESVYSVDDNNYLPDAHGFDTRTENYVYALAIVDSDEMSLDELQKIVLSGNRNSETSYHFSYSLTLNVTYTYTPVQGTYATYYRLTYENYTITSIDTTAITLSDVYMEIANNGYGDVNMVYNQQNTHHFGAQTSGTLYGSSSWTPSLSIDNTSYATSTRFYVWISAYHGTGYYTSSWNRPFF